MFSGLAIYVFFSEDPSVGSVNVLVKLPADSSLEDGVPKHCRKTIFFQFPGTDGLEFDAPNPVY